MYKSQLFTQVPRTTIKISSPDFDKSKCWHCQEFDRIKTQFNVLVWCLRCYKLQALKGDGTYAQQTTIPILKDLVDIKEGKIEPKKYEYVEKEIVQE